MTLRSKGTPAVTETIHNTINTEKHKQTFGEITVKASEPPSTLLKLKLSVINAVLLCFLYRCKKIKLKLIGGQSISCFLTLHDMQQKQFLSTVKGHLYFGLCLCSQQNQSYNCRDHKTTKSLPSKMVPVPG